MALAIRCEKGHSYVAGDLLGPGEVGGCPVCRLDRQAKLLRRLCNYANTFPERLGNVSRDVAKEQRERDAKEALAWAMRLELRLEGL